MGKRLASTHRHGQRVTARFARTSKSGRLHVTNHGPDDIYELRIELPPEAGNGFTVVQDGTVARLPVGETTSFLAMRTFGGGKEHFEISVLGHTSEGAQLNLKAFVNLAG